MDQTDSQEKIWLCNTDVETEWTVTATQEIPRRGVRQVIFHHFEEILISSIGPANTAILRKEPNATFISYLKGLGIELPEILVAHTNKPKPWKPTAQLVLEDAALMSELASRVRQGQVAVLESFGISKVIEEITSRTNLCLPYTGAETAALISRKSFNRQLARGINIPVPDGEVCETPEDLPAVMRDVHARGGGCPVVIKPELGASGRGQQLFHNENDIGKLAETIAGGEFGKYGSSYIVERWYPDSITFTYDFIIRKDGQITTPLILREALARQYGKQYGYLFPSDFGDDVHTIIRSVIELLARVLQDKYTYHGPVRCDALLLPDGHLFPILELNARHSFFYFVDQLHNRLAPDQTGLFSWFFFRSPGHLSFNEFIDSLVDKNLLFDKQKMEGVVVPIWNTVTATEGLENMENETAPPLRRLFTLIFSSTPERAQEMRAALWEALRANML